MILVDEAATAERMSLTAFELRAVRKAVVRFPLPWFDAVEQHKHDRVNGHCWADGYVEQVSGPFIANFTISRDRGGFSVCLDDGNTRLPAWRGSLTLAAALSAIWTHVETMLAAWGLACNFPGQGPSPVLVATRSATRPAI